MKSGNFIGKTWVAAAATLLVVAGAAPSHAASTNTKGEVGCYGALAKSMSKHVAAVSKAMAACQDSVIADDIPGPCPDATAQAAIDKSAAGVLKNVSKKCASKCSVSEVPCISNLSCPPNGNLPEACTDKGKNVFDATTRMGFPGPFCEAIIGGPLLDGEAFSQCISGLGEIVANELMDNIYGSLDGTSTLTADGAKCLAGIIKAAPKSAGKVAGTISKCRATQLGADPATILPDNCPTEDQKTADKVASDRQKFLDAIAKSCTDDTIDELDLCGEGVGGVTTIVEAQTCLGDLLDEAAYSIEDVENKDLAGISIINAVYPDTTEARCGDNLINQIDSQFLPVGEECDGTDDSACPGNCLPPGDVFQCTCSTIPRMRSFADGFAADLDNGWSGNSHNSAVTDRAGFLTSVANCECDTFDGVDKATCLDLVGDKVCDVVATVKPRCSNKLDTGTTCDQEGDNNGFNDDDDCRSCDIYSTNPGDYCLNDGDCQSQCFNADGDATGLCERQSDCAEGERCRGRCDMTTNFCLKMRNGAPLPISAAGTSVCIDSQFFTNVVGTRNIVTGEHAVNYDLKSVTHLAEVFSRPCPVCGGWCDQENSSQATRCDGTCSGPELQCRGGINIGNTCTVDGDCPGSVCHGLRCRFDDDCPTGTCTTATLECGGEDCRLDLICGGGRNNGQPCRIEAYTAFGTTSVDCPPNVGENISGAGLSISWTPLTSEAITLESPGACDASGYGNFDCFCVTGGGTVRNQPNRCDPTCNAGVNYGKTCSAFTVCVGGAEAGVACDEDSDCSGGGTCTGNPLECTGGSNDGTSCTSGAQCTGGGTCTANRCPGGLCTPLCVQKGECNGGANDGKFCGIDQDCPGGTCDVIPPGEEGVCAGGPTFNHCDGPGHEFRSCGVDAIGTQGDCEAGVDHILGNEDDFVGAGTCFADVRNCFVNDGASEGGDTLNGRGDATNTRSNAAYCIPASSSDSVNATAGLPGPGRIRQPALIVPNFTSLP